MFYIMARIYKRKYEYPKEYITKKGKLKKNYKRKINDWKKKMNNQTKENYNEIMLKNHYLKKENNSLIIHNDYLKNQNDDYAEALENWVLIAQNSINHHY